jgi:SAM-dependent methyltransferase
MKKPRWCSYYHQIKEVLSFVPEGSNNLSSPACLVIGVGDGIVPLALQSAGCTVKTFDNNANLHPDIVGDLRHLADYVSPNSFDVILCCQVMEHLPFEYFEKVLNDFSKIAKTAVVLSLPFSLIDFSVSIKIPKMRSEKKLLFVVPGFWRRAKYNEISGHYWEIGERNHSARRIRNSIKKYFAIKKNYLVPENLYHMFFVLRPK